MADGDKNQNLDTIRRELEALDARVRDLTERSGDRPEIRRFLDSVEQRIRRLRERVDSVSEIAASDGGAQGAAASGAVSAETLLDLIQEDFMHGLVSDPADVPSVQLLSGYLGDSSRDGYVRLYNQLDLKEYLEIPIAGIHFSKKLAAEQTQSELTQTYIWLKEGTQIFHVQSSAAQSLQELFSGPLASQASKFPCGCPPWADPCSDPCAPPTSTGEWSTRYPCFTGWSTRYPCFSGWSTRYPCQ